MDSLGSRYALRAAFFLKKSVLSIVIFISLPTQTQGETFMCAVPLKTSDPPPASAGLVAKFFDHKLIVSLPGNPIYTESMLADLLPSMRKHGQLVPGWVYPSPDLPEDKRYCLEGNRRLAVDRLIDLPFWGFDLGRYVEEPERIELMFHHHGTRRLMSREEIAERAGRYMELTGATAGDAAKVLNISAPTLSRAFGDRRILPELRSEAEKLVVSIRSLIAATPPALMAAALQFALKPGPDGKPRTRDQVALYIRELKQNDGKRPRKAQSVTLKHAGRAVTIAIIGDKDSATTVAEDLRSIAQKLNKHAEVPPNGWQFLFT